MAALYERNGTYYAQFYDDTRNPIRKRFSLKTGQKRTARKLLVRFEDDYLTGEFDPWTDDPWSYDEDEHTALQVEEAKERYLTRKQANGRTDNTIRTYREVVELLIREVGKRTVLDRIDTAEVRSFVREPSLARATQRKRYNQLKTFFRWCVKEKILKENPIEDIQAPQKPNKLPKAITESELEEVCEAVRDDYAAKREGFGVRLADRESVQVMLGDLAMQIEVGRLLVMKAAWKIDRGGFAQKEVSMAKIHVADLVHKAADVSIQINGARGYSKDTVLEWIYRYARQARLVDGADEVHKMVLNRHLAQQGRDFWRWDSGA